MRNRKWAVVISVALFLTWAWFTYNAFERRGDKTPVALRWASFW